MLAQAQKSLTAAEKALAAFEELLPFLPQAKSYLPSLEHFELENAPAVLSKMISSVRLLKDPTFTPMAAVAGSFSDLIREEIVTGQTVSFYLKMRLFTTIFVDVSPYTEE